MNWTPILTGLGLLLTCGALSSAEPANPNASAKTRAVLNYICSLANRADKRILSGQFADFGDGTSPKLVNHTHERPGHWPAILAAHYVVFAQWSLALKAPNPATTDYSRQGG